ncbi:MAG: hypothetical protein ACP5N7_03520 [Candidatus Pacearchaeota archaeon]
MPERVGVPHLDTKFYWFSDPIILSGGDGKKSSYWLLFILIKGLYMKDIAKNTLFKPDINVSLNSSQLEIINEIYGLGLSDQTIDSLNSKIQLNLPNAQTSIPILSIEHELTDSTTKKCFIALYSKSNNSAYSPSIYFLGPNLLSDEIKIGNHILCTNHGQYDNRVNSIWSNFTFNYKPGDYELNLCSLMKDKITKKYYFENRDDFENIFKTDEVIIKSHLDGADRHSNYNYHRITGIKAIYGFYKKNFDDLVFKQKLFDHNGIPTFMNKILDVQQITGTQRLVLIARPKNSYRISGTTFGDVLYDYNLYIKIVNSNESDYDYCDAGRLLIPLKYNEDAAAGDPFPAKVFFVDVTEEDIPNKSNKDPFNLYLKNRENGVLINPERLKLLLKKHQHISSLHKQKMEINEKIKQKIALKLAELETTSGKFVLNGVTYEKHNISYESNILDFHKVSPSKVLEDALRSHKADDIDFDLILDYFVSRAIRENAKKSGLSAKGKIGTIDIDLEYKGLKGLRTYINGYRINNDERIEVLKRALCYTTQDQYNDYLSQVSKCSLNIYTYLVNGLRLKIQDSFLNKELKIALPLERTKNRTILKIGNKSFPVSDINKLIALEKEWRMHVLLTKLTKGDIIKNLTTKDITFIIEQGLDFHEAMVKRDKEMRERMEKMFDISSKRVKFADGSEKAGYLVAGHFKQYFVSNTDAQAYSYPDGNRICMITKNDTSTTTDNLTVRIFERVMVLKNDARVADRVATLATFKNMETKNDG